MSREWKPGDVAADKHDGSRCIVVRRSGLGCASNHPDEPHWHYEESDWNPLDVESVRPLVVIDPEAESLPIAHVIWEVFETCGTRDFRVVRERIRTALREFANPTPPKPDEPTDLAVRVIDNQGDEWARIRRGEKSYWVNGFGGKTYSWSALVEDFGPLVVQREYGANLAANWRD